VTLLYIFSESLLSWNLDEVLILSKDSPSNATGLLAQDVEDMRIYDASQEIEFTDKETITCPARKDDIGKAMFIHMRKAGGSTFRKGIINPSHRSKFHKAEHRPVHKEFAQYNTSIVNFRDPVARYISQFQRESLKENDSGRLGFTKMGNGKLSFPQWHRGRDVNHTLGSKYIMNYYLFRLTGKRFCSASNLQIALGMLKKMYLIVIAEKYGDEGYADFINYMLHTNGTLRQTQWFGKQSNKLVDEVREDKILLQKTYSSLLERIKKENWCDYAIYNYEVRIADTCNRMPRSSSKIP